MAARFIYCDPTSREIVTVLSAAFLTADLGGRIEVEVTDAHQCFVDGVDAWRLDDAQTGIELTPLDDPVIVKNPDTGDIVMTVEKSGGLRLANVEAHTGPGIKVKRLEVFDIGGASLGYVHVFNG